MIGRLHVGILYYFVICYEIKSRFTGLGTLLTITPQSHLLQCPEIVVKLKTINKKWSELNENMIYGNIEEKQLIISIYSEVLQVRENLKEGLTPQAEGPMHLGIT